MSILVIVVHIIVCIALILIVLLQTGKGADMGAAFGGGSSQTLFGSTAPVPSSAKQPRLPRLSLC
jgi:preprotein translocase subunit SecG